MSPTTSTLADRYLIERELGRGGMATVFLARDLRHDTLVALKLMHPDLSPLFAGERFAREIRITASLQHPNILTVLDSGEVDGVPFYTMPYVEGESLAARLEREHQLPIDDALCIAADVADALVCAHARGLIHRDIKPDNILLSHGRAILADFGIARAMDVAGRERITESGIALGTATYMSPEQAAAGDVDGRSDIYATACVVYEMLVGNAPFVGGTPMNIMARHAVDPVPSVRSVRGTVSPAVERVITKALAKVPADRFADAAAFRAAIAHAAREQAGPWRPSTATSKRDGARWRAAVVAGALIAVVVAGAFVWRTVRPARALDRNRITVFPLAVSRDLKGSPAVGEDISTLIGQSLDGTGPLRWIDGARLLVGTGTHADGGVDPALARSLATNERSRFYLTGRVVPRGDSIETFLTLFDVAGDSIVRQGHATGTSAEPWRAGLRAVNTILPALVPGATQGNLAAEWTDRAPDAVANFLLGEASFRRARAAEALTHYREAVRLDSTFAIAAIRGAQAATWEHRSSEADSLIHRALAQRMSPRFTHFALGYDAYLEGRPDSAVSELHRALAIDPEMSAAWMQLGETYTHLLPLSGRVDTLADAAFAEALRLDSSAAHMLFHPIESRLRRGRVADAAPLLARWIVAQPDTMLGAQLRVMNACVAHGVDAVHWSTEIAAHPLAVLGAAQSLAVGGSQLPCAESAYAALRRYETPEMAAADAAVDARRWTALVGLTGILIAEGRFGEVTAHVDSAIASKEGGISLYLVGGALAPELASRAADAAARTIAQSGAACERCNTDRVWQMAVWAAAARDTTALVALRGTLSALATRAAPKTRGDSSAATMAAGASAGLALLRHDTAAARDGLRGTLATAARSSNGKLVWSESEARGPERLAYARLLAAQHEYKQALDVADVFDSPASQSYVMYLPASLALRAAMADSLGDAALASSYRKRRSHLRAVPRADASHSK